MYPKVELNEEWIISEERIERGKLGYWETLFTLGNGYLGSRGILEEQAQHPGTYLAGIYDKGKIVNSPNPLGLEIWVKGRKLGTDQILEHQRILDMKRGLLLRHTVFRQGKSRYDYRSKRFFSLTNKHLGGMQAIFKSLDEDTEVIVRSKIDGRAKSKLFGKTPKQYSVTEVGKKGKLIYLVANTLELEIEACFATSLEVLEDGKPVGTFRFSFDKEACKAEVTFRAKKRNSYRINKLISIFTSKDTQHAKEACLSSLEARKLGNLLKSHQEAWRRRWQHFDLELEGDPEAQRAIRFSLYHLLIAAPPKDIDISIPPNALTGEAYQGHIFWDTEIYMLPFFIYTWPKKARDLIRYRYRRLDKAKLGAKKQGYAGSLWPWESALSGEDVAPNWWVNFDGSRIPIYTKQREHHISGDVCYAIALYYQLTKDEKFMLEKGAEIIFETARFWASRVIYNAKNGKYKIREVIGPNEFQVKVDNNFYTNFLASWTLRYAHGLFYLLRKEYPSKLKAVATKIELKRGEVNNWREIAKKIKLLVSPDGLIEEFEGYFKRKNIIIDKWDERGMPYLPAGVKISELKETQLVKQADVLLALYLFSSEFSFKVKEKNFEYYELRTLHKSSLSIPSYALIALELGKFEKAYRYFNLLAKTDLADLFGNTKFGIHGGALGETWQVVVLGFAGVKSKEDRLSINPSLPKAWQSLRFKLKWRGHNFEFRVYKNKTEVFLRTAKKVRLPIEVYNKTYYIHANESLMVEK